MENKKAELSMVSLIVVCFICLMALVILAIVSYGAGQADDIFSTINITLGNQSFNENYNNSLKPALNVLEVNGPREISIGLFIGMILCLLFASFKAPKKANIWLILDVLIIIVAEMFAYVISTTFQTTILNLSPDFFNIFTTTLNLASRWIIALPVIIPVVGTLIIIVTYVIRKDVKDDSPTYNAGDY